MRRAIALAALTAVITTLSACRAEPTISPQVVSTTERASVAKAFDCLPADAAFMAAHRGTHQGSAFPENSLSALNQLISIGFYFAEIDVAAINDGTHILYHDGTWDKKSSGTGPIAATPNSVFQTITLRDTTGLITGEKAPLLDDFLKTAKDKIFLEIDFKSSARYEAVIKTIRDHNMADQVILIAYTAGQAKKLANLAPEMMLSVSAKSDADIKALQRDGVELEQMAVWRGRSEVNSKLVENLRGKGVPILRLAPKSGLKQAAKASNLLVTDSAFDVDPIIGLTSKTRTQFETCLNN